MIRDPYRRVDIIESSREIAVEVDGIELARSTNARLVLETAMPALWYLPLIDIETAQIQPSNHSSTCQYKGQAQYWHVNTSDVHENLIWGYQDPIPAAARLAGFACITPWSPHVQTILEGQPIKVGQPNSDWSNPLTAATERSPSPSSD